VRHPAFFAGTAATGATRAAGARFLWQCLHTIAAAWISSAQNGHVFTVGDGAEVVGVTTAGAVFLPGKRSRPQCGQTVAASAISFAQNRHFLIALSYRRV